MASRVFPIRKFVTVSVVTLLFILPFAVRGAGSEKRVALVIGNGTYQHGRKLPNAPHDADAIANKLTSLGFAVDLAKDQDREGMRRALEGFGPKLQDADVALFFYAGHGLQLDGRNYLIPVDATLLRQTDVVYQTFELEQILEQISLAKAGLVFLDSCRKNPWASNLSSPHRTMGDGLAEPGQKRPLKRLLIAFATGPNSVALEEGPEGHSPFTYALLQHLDTAGVEVESMMKRVTASVEMVTNQQQSPWKTSALTREIFLGDTSSGSGNFNQPNPGLPGPGAPPASDSRRPLYKKWWFWTLVAGGTAIVATGLGVGLALKYKPQVFDATFSSP